MDSKKLALLCQKCADDKKAENIAVLDVRELSTVTDFFVIASASSEPHLRAIADEITEKVREQTGQKPQSVDGSIRASWMVVDYVDVIIHLMRAEVRARYDLEGLWGDAPKVKPRQPRARKPAPPA
jgi:ribosome-associated protein